MVGTCQVVVGRLTFSHTETGDLGVVFFLRGESHQGKNGGLETLLLESLFAAADADRVYFPGFVRGKGIGKSSACFFWT